MPSSMNDVLMYNKILFETVKRNPKYYEFLTLKRLYKTSVNLNDKKYNMVCNQIEKYNFQAYEVVLNILSDFLKFEALKEFYSPKDRLSVNTYSKHTLNPSKRYELDISITTDHINIEREYGFSFFNKNFELYDFLKNNKYLFINYIDKLSSNIDNQNDIKCYHSLKNYIITCNTKGLSIESTDYLLMKFMNENMYIWSNLR